MEYKVVELYEGYSKFECDGAEAARRVEEALNRYAVDGWKFDRIASVTSTENHTTKQGCGKKAKDVSTSSAKTVWIAIFIKD